MSSPALSVSEQLSLIEDLDLRQNDLLDQLDALNGRIEQVLAQVQPGVANLTLHDAA